MSETKPKPAKLAETIDYNPDHQSWLNPKVEFKHGVFNYSGNPQNVDYLKLPNSRKWQPTDDDWKLPENWKEIILEGLKDRLQRFRSLQLFMDICVRCGACADKCHFFIGSGDPKNMPVLRAELLRSVYRNNFTLGGNYLVNWLVDVS